MLSKVYGEDLVCIRYKYDYKNKIKYKTVELIVEKNPWTPSSTDPLIHRRVYIRVLPYEKVIRNQIKLAGGIWNGIKKLWKIPIHVVWDLNLEDRIVNINKNK